eukprot:COSAG05_NODE_119_length_17779_cov_273.146049_9_plen_528_part_00
MTGAYPNLSYARPLLCLVGCAGAQAVGVMITLNCLILISTSCFIIETMPQFRQVSESTWFTLEAICIAGFTIDFVIRMVCTPDCKAFWTEFMNMVDFVAIMPFYVEMAVKLVVDDAPIPQYLRVIRVVRLARVLRIIRMTKAGKMAGVIVDIAKTAANALVVPVYFMYTLIVIAATGVYYSEKGEPVSCLAMTHADVWTTEMAKLHPLAETASMDGNADGVKDGNYLWEDADGKISSTPQGDGKWIDYDGGSIKPSGNVTDSELVRFIQRKSAADEDEDLDMTHNFCHKYPPYLMKDSKVTGADTSDKKISKAEWYFDRIFGAKSPNFINYQTGQDQRSIGGKNMRTNSTYNCDAKIETCCYCLRNGVYTDGVGYESVPDGIWFIFVTMTTVGYGDIFPVTWAGRGVAMATMCTAVFCIAMPLTIVGTSLNLEWEELEHQRHEVEEEELKDDVKKWMRELKADASELKVSLSKFADDYIAAGTKAEKLALVKDSFCQEEIQKQIDDMSASLGDAFELVDIRLLDNPR